MKPIFSDSGLGFILEAVSLKKGRLALRPLLVGLFGFHLSLQNFILNFCCNLPPTNPDAMVPAKLATR